MLLKARAVEYEIKLVQGQPHANVKKIYKTTPAIT